jgi:hypothetical protein
LRNRANLGNGFVRAKFRLVFRASRLDTPGPGLDFAKQSQSCPGDGFVRAKTLLGRRVPKIEGGGASHQDTPGPGCDFAKQSQSCPGDGFVRAKTLLECPRPACIQLCKIVGGSGSLARISPGPDSILRNRANPAASPVTNPFFWVSV